MNRDNRIDAGVVIILIVGGILFNSGVVFGAGLFLLLLGRRL